MICRRAWTSKHRPPGLKRWCDLVDEQEDIKHRLESVNLAILRLCVITGITLDEATAMAKEGM